jgi:DNA topoisomerase IA
MKLVIAEKPSVAMALASVPEQEKMATWRETVISFPGA